MTLHKIFFLVIFACLLAGCAADSVEQDSAPLTGDAIMLSFGENEIESVETETRGVSVNSEAGLTTVGLFGLRYPASSTYAAEMGKATGIPTAGDYIYNDNLTKTDKGWKANYSWPGTSNKATLMAYSPYNPTGVTFSTQTTPGMPTITYTVPDQAENHADLLVGDSIDILGNTWLPVKINLKHICARIVVRCYNQMPVSVKFNYINNTGNYVAGAGWQGVSKTRDDVVVTHTYSGGTDEGATYAETVFFMPPQTVPDHAQIEVEYNDGATSDTQYYNIEGDEWVAGETCVYDVYKRDATVFYTGDVSEYTVIESGVYKLEVWGAEGGYGSGTTGKGGYAYGSVRLNIGEKLYLVIGGQNSYNGGGTPGAGNGGGATHIARNIDLGVLKNYIDNQDDILIVAGGGGSAEWAGNYGGSGGGETGGSAYGGARSNVGIITGGSGTQTSGGSGAYFKGNSSGWGGHTNFGARYGESGSFGQGGIGYAVARDGYVDYGPAGGGGWYGGGGCPYAGGSGGGSGHLGSQLLTTEPSGMSNGVRYGHGLAKITYVGP